MPYRDKRKQKKAQAEWYQRNKDTIGKRKSQQKSAAKQWVYEYKLKYYHYVYLFENYFYLLYLNFDL